MNENDTRFKIKDYIHLYNKHFIRDKKDDYNPTFLKYIIINFFPFPVICILFLLFILNFEVLNLMIAVVIIVFIGSIMIISVILFVSISRKTFIFLYHLPTNFFERLRYEKIKFSLEKSKFSPKLEIEIDKYSISNPAVEFINQTKKMHEKLSKKTRIESSLCCVFFIINFVLTIIIQEHSEIDIYFYFLISTIGLMVILAYLCISFLSVDYFLKAVLGADIERWHSIGRSDKWKEKLPNNF